MEGRFGRSETCLPPVEGTFWSSEMTFHPWMVILGHPKPPSTGGRSLPGLPKPPSARGRHFLVVQNGLPRAEGTFGWLNLTIYPPIGKVRRPENSSNESPFLTQITIILTKTAATLTKIAAVLAKTAVILAKTEATLAKPATILAKATTILAKTTTI